MSEGWAEVHVRLPNGVGGGEYRGGMVKGKWFRLEWGSEQLDFDSEDDLIAFVREQGCERVTYRTMWLTLAA